MKLDGIFRVEYQWPIGGTIMTGTVDMTLANGSASGQNADLVMSGTYTLSNEDMVEMRMGARLAQTGPDVQPIPFWLEGKILEGPFQLIGNYDTSNSKQSEIVADCTRLS